jgi:REP element-mobilizing transposase RayT
MHLIQRKRLRLKGFDYSSAGCYFVTIATYNKIKLFWDYDKLNDIGKLVENDIQLLSSHFKDVKVDNFVVMPNHIHMLITIGCDALESDDILLKEVLGQNSHPKLEIVVGSLKSGITRKIHKLKPDINVWQKSYFDHIISNEKEYNEIWDYIDANPIRWKIKCGYVKL